MTISGIWLRVPWSCLGYFSSALYPVIGLCVLRMLRLPCRVQRVLRLQGQWHWPEEACLFPDWTGPDRTGLGWLGGNGKGMAWLR